MRTHTWVKLGVLWGMLMATASAAAAPSDEARLAQTIEALDSLSASEREQVLPSVLEAISRQSDPYIEGRLSVLLEQRLASWTRQSQTAIAVGQAEQEVEDRVGTAQEEKSFESLRKQWEEPLPSEHELRYQIEQLTLDPKAPELGLTKGMEIAGVIDRIQDPELQTTLRKFLESKLVGLQNDLGL